MKQIQKNKRISIYSNLELSNISQGHLFGGGSLIYQCSGKGEVLRKSDYPKDIEACKSGDTSLRFTCSADATLCAIALNVPQIFGNYNISESTILEF